MLPEKCSSFSLMVLEELYNLLEQMAMKAKRGGTDSKQRTQAERKQFSGSRNTAVFGKNELLK